MFYAENRRKLGRAMAEAGLEELRFRFDFDGTRILLQ
jgi:D-glycero-alpha-D-manno-heptose-7-phosphate kinase